MNTNKTTLVALLQDLETELKKQELWNNTPPETQALMSAEPFCVDTLAFEQWLQWICIPKLKNLIDSKGFSGLSNKSDMHSMATYAFKDYQCCTDTIGKIIKNIDMSLNTF